jgi:hypothetical protein
MSKSLSSILRGTNYGTLPISAGGTGGNTAATALTALGAQAILPAANGSANGYLTSTDWTTFNSKLSSYTLPTAGASTLGGIKVGTGLTIDGNGILTTTNSGTVTSVAGTAPIASSGGATPTISIAAATTSVSGYLTSTDWNTFNSKQAALVSATNIKTVNGTTLLGSGDLVISGGASATKTIANKTAAYTVVAGDLGKIINCTSGTFTVSLTAAATLGAGFVCTIWNTSIVSNDVITIDPNASESLDYCNTKKLRSGEGFSIISDGVNWQTDNKKPMKGYAENFSNLSAGAIASGSYGVRIGSEGSSTGDQAYAIGHQAIASSTDSYSIGRSCTASGYASHSIGNSCTAASNYSTALGTNSAASGSVTATGAGAMALGGSYASGVNSFAAAIGNNTSTYGTGGLGSIAMGVNSKATTTNAVAIGSSSTASGVMATALGNATASGERSFAVGYGWQGNTLASAKGSFALGADSVSNIIGKFTYASEAFGAGGDAQFGKLVLRAATTTTTAVVLTSNGAAASTTNQLIVATNQAMTFFGTLIAKQSASANMASYLIKGAIVNNAGTVSISSIAIETIVDTIGLTTQPTYTADNTNKGLTVTSGAKATTNIRWVCNLDSVEVTYA